LAAVTAEVALVTARTLLNDDAGLFYPDAVLIPKLQQAWRQMVSTLRITAADLLITTAATNVNSGVANITFTDINEPITLWEKVQGQPDSTYVKMTEYNPLPNFAAGATLGVWQWDGAQINFIAATGNQTVKTKYWRVLPEPTSGTSSLIFINAEYYLGPMIAGIMAGVLGEADQLETLSTGAISTLQQIINANRGRQTPPGSVRP
jgi:hypothetical protein